MVVTALALTMLSQAPLFPTAVQIHDALLVPDPSGKPGAWHLKDLTRDQTLSTALEAGGPQALATDGDKLLGFDGSRLRQWEDATHSWVDVAATIPKAPTLAFAIVEHVPVAILAGGVHRLTDGKFYKLPAFSEQIRGDVFVEGVRTYAVHGTQLAIGTSYGEWGGHLWILDIRSGQWSKHYDALAGVTGLTWDGSGWVVTWSMSHMSASTRIRRHDPHAKVLTESPEVRGQYLRAVAVDPETKQLTAIEQQSLVTVDPATLTWKPQKALSAISYGAEHQAVGVSSGIALFTALPGNRLLLIPTDGPARVLGEKAATVLSPPTPDAGSHQ